MTPREAAEACGVSERSIRGRIERGTLRIVKRGGRVQITTVDLLAAGLIPDDTPGNTGRVEPGTPARGQDGIPESVVVLLGETIRALQVAEAEAGRLRGVLESTEAKERRELAATEAAHAEVFELRARVRELEAQAALEAASDSRSWWNHLLGRADV